VGLITEKQLRGVRRKLFNIMDSVIINSENDEVLNKNGIMGLALKVVGLSVSDVLTKQLWAEYKTWQQTKNDSVKELRNHEKKPSTNNQK